MDEQTLVRHIDQLIILVTIEIMKNESISYFAAKAKAEKAFKLYLKRQKERRNDQV